MIHQPGSKNKFEPVNINSNRLYSLDLDLGLDLDLELDLELDLDTECSVKSYHPERSGIGQMHRDP